MAEQTYHQAGLQHLAHLQQDSVHRQGASVLQHQQQAALIAVQALERERLHQAQVMRQPQAGEQLQSRQAVENLDQPRNKTQYYKEIK